jgi:hypothetical protein
LHLGSKKRVEYLNTVHRPRLFDYVHLTLYLLLRYGVSSFRRDRGSLVSRLHAIIHKPQQGRRFCLRSTRDFQRPIRPNPPPSHAVGVQTPLILSAPLLHCHHRLATSRDPPSYRSQIHPLRQHLHLTDSSVKDGHPAIIPPTVLASHYRVPC